MNTFESFPSLLYTVNDQSFDHIALSLFQLQASHNKIYKEFIDNLSIKAQDVTAVEHIPFMPISLFKNHIIKTGEWKSDIEFVSSGTTGSNTSTHHLFDFQFYLSHAEKCFVNFFGEISDYHFLAFLPSYEQRKNASLIAMINYFIKKSDSPFSGFYLNDTERLVNDLMTLKGDSRKTILWGVSFALLDLVEKHEIDLSHCLVFETGGMKGRRKEITKEELHTVLKKGLNVDVIYSEYGMTEMLSQAYAKGHEFECSPWMKVCARELTDPFQQKAIGEMGGLNIIDLANWHSIAFIETEDLGRINGKGRFEVLGRIDNSDIRGCNLMVE